MLISEKLDRARRCRENFLAARNGLKSAVGSIKANMTQMSAAIAAAQGLGDGIDHAELAEWEGLFAEATAALAEHAETITTLMGE